MDNPKLNIILYFVIQDEQASHLTDLLKEKKIKEFGEYLDEKIPESASILQEEVKKFREKMIDAVKE